MSTLQDESIFTLKRIIKRFNTKLSAVTEYNKREQVLCLIDRNNEILLRLINEDGFVKHKLISWFQDFNRIIQDVCFDPTGVSLLILCYDNTLHVMQLESIFDESQKDGEIISYVVPFVGPHECPNPQTCPNNLSIYNSTACNNSRERQKVNLKTKISGQENVSPDVCSTNKIEEFMASNQHYSTFYGRKSSIPQDDEENEKIILENNKNSMTSSSLGTFKSFSSSQDSNTFPCPYPTCVLWWYTLNCENRAIVGYSDGTICFVGLTPNCPFIANTSVEKGAIDKLTICKDSSMEIISLMINTSIQEQWKLLLEQNSISYTFPGDPSMNPSNENDQRFNRQNSENYEDWQIVLSLDKNKTEEENSSEIPPNSFSSDESVILQKSDETSFSSGILPAARARLASLKDLGAKKIGALKMKLAESRMKASEKERIKEECASLAVMDVPGLLPEILTTPGGAYFIVQYFKNKYLLSALHSYSDTLSVHSMDVSLIPLYLYKMPNSCKNILLTSNIMYTAQTIESEKLTNSIEIIHEDENDEINTEENKQKIETESISGDTESLNKIDVINIISCAMSSMRIGDDCDFNNRALLAQFSFPNEKIINIHRKINVLSNKSCFTEEKRKSTGSEFYYLKEYSNYHSKLEHAKCFDMSDIQVLQNIFPEIELEKCYIVTDKNVYCIELSDCSHIIFLNMANSALWSACEDFCKTFNLLLAQCIEFAGDVFLKRKKVTQALLTYNIARIPPIKTALKLASFGECNALMHLCAMALKNTHVIKSKYLTDPHMRYLLKTANLRMEDYEDIKIDQPNSQIGDVNSGKPCSDFNYSNDEISADLQMSSSSQFHLSNFMLMTLCEKCIRDSNFVPLWNYLATNQRYHSNLSSIVLCESGFYAAAVLVAKIRGACLNVFLSLVRVADTADKFMDINAIMFNLSDQIFMECITYAYFIALEYFLNVRKNVQKLSREVLERLKIQLNPFNEIYRPIVSKLSSQTGDRNSAEIFNKEYHDFCKNMIETYILVLMQLQSLESSQSNFLHALNTFHIQYEENQFAIKINDSSPMSAGFSQSACIVDGSIYIWGSNGVNYSFNLNSLESDKSEQMFLPKRLVVLSNLDLEVHAVKCGRTHIIILTNNGLYTIGSNNLGQLGIGRQLSQALHPVLVRSLNGKNISQMSAGQYHNAIVADGCLYTWGWGVFGQLGHGTIEDIYEPKLVEFFVHKKIKDISLGHGHTLVLCHERNSYKPVLYVFGSNHFGQLGVGHENTPYSSQQLLKSLVPIKLEFTESIKIIHTNFFSNLVVTESNTLYTWGLSPQSLRLATQARKRAKASQKIAESLKNEMAQHSQEVQKCNDIVSEETVGNIVIKVEHCESPRKTIDETEKPKDEVKKEEHLSPEDENNEHLLPIKVDTCEVAGEIIQLASGLYHSALITSSSFLYTWGKNLERQLGHEGPRVDTLIPTRLDIEHPLYVDCGCDFTLVMTKDFVVRAFGNNNSGQCGKEIIEKPGYTGKLVRLRVSKRVVRIPDGSQYVETPTDVNLPRPKIRMDLDPIRYLKNVPKFQQNYLTLSSLSETIDLGLMNRNSSKNTTIDSNLNELCNESDDDLRLAISDLNLNCNESVILNCQSPDFNLSDLTTNSAQTSSILRLSKLPKEKTLNDFIHYCLFIFYGLYDQNKLLTYSEEYKEYRIRILMLNYKFLDAFKICLTDTRESGPKSLKIFEYFTKDSNIFPMHTEDLKFFIYEIFTHFIRNDLNLIEVEKYFLGDLEFYLIQLAFVLFFNNNNSDLERNVFMKYKDLFGDLDVVDNHKLENTEIIFKNLSTKFCAIVCQRLTEYSSN